MPRARARADDRRRRCARALDHKDAAAIAAVGGRGARCWRICCGGGRGDAGAEGARRSSTCRREAAAERARLELWWPVSPRAARPRLTIDPVENCGFEYHTGISFAFLRRAGSRASWDAAGAIAPPRRGEPATGFTLYTDTILQAAPPQPLGKRLYVPAGIGADTAAQKRGEGWITVAGLAPAADEGREAKRLGCGHRLAGGKIVPVG